MWAPLFDETDCDRGPTDEVESMFLKIMLLSVAHVASTLPPPQNFTAAERHVSSSGKLIARF